VNIKSANNEGRLFTYFQMFIGRFEIDVLTIYYLSQDLSSSIHATNLCTNLTILIQPIPTACQKILQTYASRLFFSVYMLSHFFCNRTRQATVHFRILVEFEPDRLDSAGIVIDDAKWFDPVKSTFAGHTGRVLDIKVKVPLLMRRKGCAAFYDANH